jgi:hypothetical protein
VTGFRLRVVCICVKQDGGETVEKRRRGSRPKRTVDDGSLVAAAMAEYAGARRRERIGRREPHKLLPI